MSRFPAWHFRSMEPAEMHVDPVHDEFFKAQDLADALVRESIQNSLDARASRSRSAVRVRFRFASGAHALHPDALRDYFDGLEPHLHAASKTMHTILPRPDEAMPYLLIEDFGTRGLTGDPQSDPELDEAGDEKNDFFYFWRNVGRSNKGEVDRGRWGLGKAVFTVASRIRTVFGLTRRADDNRTLLLGQSVLKTHVIDGRRVYPYGFFARFEKKNGLPLPIEDPILLDRFADDFSVNRIEPGLSIVVPYYRDDELSLPRITASVVRQYFYPILSGALIVEVVDGKQVQRIAADTLEALTADDADVSRLCALTRWSLAQKEETRIVLPERGNGAPKWDDSILEPGELTSLRELFASRERLAFRVPIQVKRKKARAAANSWFDVFIEYDDALRKSEHHFIRRGITIPDVRTNGDKGARALIVIDDQALSTFLGDAENPAHSDWSERADKIRMLYEYGASTLRFVKKSAPFLATLLARPPEGRVRDFLADLFSIDMPEDGELDTVLRRIPIRAAAGTAGEGDASGTPTTRGSGVTIARIAGGFTIKATDPSLVGRPMRGEVAYRVRAGNPFRKHSPFDFDLLSEGEITVQADGVRLRTTSVNGFELVPSAAKFQLSMKGFDSRRDLIVRVVDANDAPETELH
jgi:hypothetical protein